MDERFRDRLIRDEPRKIFFIQRESEVGPAVEHLLKFDMLGYDVETYHSIDRSIAAFDPTNGARMRLAQFGTPEGDAYVFDLYRVSKNFLHWMFPNKYLCVGQNLKFELRYLMFEMGIYDFGPLWDTMVAEQITAKGRVADRDRVPVGLDKIAERRLKIYLPKDEQASDWYMNDLSESQIRYAARDAMVVLPLYQLQRDVIKEQAQVRVAELEFDVLAPLASMENNGIRMEAEQWLRVCDETEKEITKVKHELWDMLGHQGTLFEGIQSINLNSRPQVQASFQRVGIELPLDRDGKVSMSGKLLKPIQHRREVKLYMEYVKLAKAISSYGRNWVDKINVYDGRIHGSLMGIGAETGRMAARDPNMMQIPKKDLYRNCFKAEPGWVFIDADYSQCELRILAEYCRDKNLLLAFDNQYDLHRYSASLIFKCLMEAVTDIQRGIAKNLNFGIVYGIGVTKFAMDAGIPIEEAEVIMNYYLREAYPGMGGWLESRAKMVLMHLEAETMLGRKRQYQGDLSDDQFKAAVQRNAKNLPIQGTNADITKRALALCYKRVKGDIRNVRMTLPVHDEIIIEAKGDRAIVEQSQWHLTESMLEAEREFLKRVPSVVDCNLSLEWCKEPTEAQKKAVEALLN